MTSITVYDGANTIGGNKIYVQDKENGVFLDFGMNFAKYGKYFQEFLNERSSRGIYDLITLNLIPKLNIYREDLIPSDLDIKMFPSLKVDAVVLTHAHLDHFGNIGLLNSDYPIISSAPTIALLKGILDTSSAKLGNEVAYFTKKIYEDEDDRIIKADRTNDGKDIGRDFICVTPVAESFNGFMATGVKSKKSFEEGSLSCIDDCSLDIDLKAFEVDHSIYGSTAYILSGEQTIAYSGDFRLHGKRGAKSKHFINSAKDASILIIEGTRAAREDINESEDIVFQNCLKAVEQSKGLVIADFSGRNFERLEIFQEIAKKQNRKLIITAKDAYLLQALKTTDGIDRTKDILIFKELKASLRIWEKDQYESMKEKYIDPGEISKHPSNYLLCFSLFDLKHLLDIKPGGGTYIYSSSEAFEEESEFDFVRLYNWLNFFRFKIYGFELIKQDDRLKPHFVKGYHASGHAAKSDLIWAIETINPDIVIPVHTDNPEWFIKEKFNAKVVLLKDGETFKTS